MKKILLLSVIVIFSCSGGDDSSDNNDNSNQTFLERYDGVVWEYYNGGDTYPEGCFYYPLNNAFVFKNNPPSKMEFPLYDPILNCNTILFSNPDYNIIEYSTNFLSYTYEDSLGVHLRTYTVSDDGNTLEFQDENCQSNSIIEFIRTELEFNPSDYACN